MQFFLLLTINESCNEKLSIHPKHDFCVVHFCARDTTGKVGRSGEVSRVRRVKITDEKSWKLIGSRNPKTYGLGRLCKRQDSNGNVITFRGFAPSRELILAARRRTRTKVVNHGAEF